MYSNVVTAIDKILRSYYVSTTVKEGQTPEGERHDPFNCVMTHFNFLTYALLTLCKKESRLQSKKMDFSQEKSRKSQFF